MSTITAKNELVASAGRANWVQRHPLTAYFVTAYAGTWAMVIPLAMSTGYNLFPLPDLIFILLFVLSSYTGPMLGAMLVAHATEGGAGVRRLLKGMVQWRVGAQWYIAAIFSMLVIWLAAYSVIYNGAPIQALMASPLLLSSLFLPKLIEGIFIPSIGEEVGWRGFALPRLQAQYGPVLGSLILGILHGIWHLPALFTPFLGPFTPMGFVTFVLTAMFGTFLYTWVFNRSRGSILIAILMHAGSNAASVLMNELLPKGAALPGFIQALLPGWYNVIVFGLIALALVIFTRGRLGYRSAGGQE